MKYKNITLIFAVLSILSVWGCSNYKIPKDNDPNVNTMADNALLAEEGAVLDSKEVSKEDGAESEPKDLSNDDWIELDPVDRPQMGDAIHTRAWALANNKFGLRLLNSMSGNVVVSPYSIQRCLGMLLDGAKGDTAEGLLKVLGMPDAKQLSLTGLDIEEKLLNVPADVTVEIDNRIWLNSKITDAFKRRLLVAYHGKFEIGPISHVKINAKVAETTHGLIKEIIPYPLPNNTAMILVNTIYLKAKWNEKYRFDKKATKSGVFKGFERKQTVQMMHKVLTASVIRNEYYDRIDLSFSSDSHESAHYVFRIILPKESGENGLILAEKFLFDEDEVYQIRNNRKMYKVTLSLPKFEFKSDLMRLGSYFIANGAKLAFDGNYQNLHHEFNGIIAPISLNEIFHKTVVKIDEEGGEAAAATATGFLSGKMDETKLKNIEFNVDRPFLFEILETRTKTVLFVGRITQIPE